MDFIKKHWLKIAIIVAVIAFVYWKRAEIADFLGMEAEEKPTGTTASKPDPIPQVPGVSNATPATI